MLAFFFAITKGPVAQCDPQSEKDKGTNIFSIGLIYILTFGFENNVWFIFAVTILKKLE